MAAHVGAVVKLRVLSNSQQKCYRRCAREHYFAYTLGYRPIEVDENLRFGSLIHLGLEHWWRAPEGRLEAAIEALRDQTDNEYELAKAGVMLQGYDLRWRDDPYEVIAVESEFRAPLLNPDTGAASRTFELGGVLDVLVRNLTDGRIKLMEHKTSSDDIGPGSDYWKRLRIDSQISIYLEGVRALTGHAISECVYDVLGKPGLRPSSIPERDEHGSKIVLDKDGERVRTKAGKWRETASAADGYVLQTRPETPDEYRQRLVEHIADNPERYYQRGAVVRLDTEKIEAMHDAWGTARMIRDSELSGRWPRNVDSCVRWGRSCDYFAVCTGEASLEDFTRYRKLDNVHQELSAAFGLVCVSRSNLKRKRTNDAERSSSTTTTTTTTPHDARQRASRQA